MPDRIDFLKEAREARAVASRARKWADLVSDPADRDRIRQYADELAATAVLLEQEAEGATAAPPIF
jgi:hypothetical protein